MKARRQVGARFVARAWRVRFRRPRGDSQRHIRWWSRHIAPEFHPRVKFPLAVALTGGSQALDESPRMIVGTIHPVTGGQADAVLLFPDLSAAVTRLTRSTERKGTP